MFTNCVTFAAPAIVYCRNWTNMFIVCNEFLVNRKTVHYNVFLEWHPFFIFVYFLLLLWSSSYHDGLPSRSLDCYSRAERNIWMAYFQFPSEFGCILKSRCVSPIVSLVQSYAWVYALFHNIHKRCIISMKRFLCNAVKKL